MKASCNASPRACEDGILWFWKASHCWGETWMHIFCHAVLSSNLLISVSIPLNMRCTLIKPSFKYAHKKTFLQAFYAEFLANLVDNSRIWYQRNLTGIYHRNCTVARAKTVETLCAGKAKQNSKQTCLFPSPEAESKFQQCFPPHGVSQKYMCCYDFCLVPVEYGNDSPAIFVIISQSVPLDFSIYADRNTVMPHD